MQLANILVADRSRPMIEYILVECQCIVAVVVVGLVACKLELAV